MRIVWYLARYHDIKISDATVSRMLKRNGVNRFGTLWHSDTGSGLSANLTDRLSSWATGQAGVLLRRIENCGR